MTASRSSGSIPPPIIHIRPMRRTWRELGIRQILGSHELLYFLVLRTLKLRYKQTAFGVGWAVLQPVLAMLAFTVVFGRFARLPSEGLPYAVFAYTGLVAWTYFANALTSASAGPAKPRISRSLSNFFIGPRPPSSHRRQRRSWCRWLPGGPRRRRSWRCPAPPG